MIRPIAAALAIATLLGAASAAADEHAALDFADDVFRAGGSVVFAGPEAGDAFLAGERVELAAPLAGAAHLAGRRVETAAPVGGALYAFGADVRVGAPVGGAATLAGYDVLVAGEVGGNLRAAGNHVAVEAPVGGGALLAGRRVELDAAIAGDATIAADRLAFGPGARVDGRLTLFEEPGETAEVPASVVPPERLDRRVAARDGRVAGVPAPGWAAVAAGFVIGVLIVAALATLVPTLAPRGVERLARIVDDRPLRTFGAGFLALSALTGAAAVLAATLIGVVLAPFALLAAAALGLLGYLVGVYLLGSWAVTRAGALEPDSFAEYALAALIGAAIVGLLAFLPFAGWLVALVLAFTGAGALATAWLAPRLDPLAGRRGA
jgi:hypothetical protein